MIRLISRFMERRLVAEEKAHGISLAYLRCMLRAAPAHFFKFLKVMPLAGFRRVLPPEVYHLARIVTARHEGCGSCLQSELYLARMAGTGEHVIQAALMDNPCSLLPNLAEVHLFTQSVLERTEEEDLYRESIVQRYGENGLIELALAIAVGRMFPTVKRALGYSTHCAQGAIRATDDKRSQPCPPPIDPATHPHEHPTGPHQA